MFRTVCCLVSLSLSFVATAKDTTSYGDEGFWFINLNGVPEMIHLSVNNVSGSPNADERLLELASLPQIEASGDVVCAPGYDAESVHLSFGPHAQVTETVNGPLLQEFIWDSSEPLAFPGFDNDESYEIAHELYLPPHATEWGFLEFNPSLFVESELYWWVEGGESAAEFLSTDWVWETSFPMHVVAWCSDGENLVPGVRTREMPVTIFYHADPNVTDAPVGTAADTLAAPDPATGDTRGDVTTGTTADPGTGTATATATASTSTEPAPPATATAR